MPWPESDTTKSVMEHITFHLLKQISKPINEVVPVGIILKKRPPLYSTNDNVPQCFEGIYYRLALHNE